MKRIETNMKKLLIAFIGLNLISSCSGSMDAVSSTGNTVKFKYTSGVTSDEYTAVVGNESFKGRAVQVDVKTTFGTAFGQAFSSYGTATGVANQINTSSGGKVKATLIGSKGSTLKCLMQYADSTGITLFGGVGECIHSDGSVIDVVW